MIRIGIEFDRTTVNGRTYRRIAPFIEGPNVRRTAAYIAAAITVFAFAAVALYLTDVPPTHPTVDVAAVVGRGM